MYFDVCDFWLIEYNRVCDYRKKKKKKKNGALNLIYVSSLFQNLGAFVFMLRFLVLIELVSYESFP